MAKCPACEGDLPEQAKQCPHCGADVTWWLSRDGEVYGPYDEQTVRYIVRDRRASLQDPAMIGREGTWHPLGELLDPEQSRASETAAQPELQKSRKQVRHRHWSVGGWLLYIAILLVVCGVVAGAVVWPTYQRLAAGDEEARSRSHLRQVYLALELYAHDNDGRLPPSGQWRDSIEGFVGPQCLEAPSREPYWLNDALGGMTMAELASAEVPPILAAEPGALESTRTEKEFVCLRADGTIKPQPARHIQKSISAGRR